MAALSNPNGGSKPRSYVRNVRVKSGDTLSGIAKSNKTTVAALYKANPSLAKRKAEGKVEIFANTLIKLPGKPVTPKKGPSKDYGPSAAPKKNSPKASDNYGPGKIPTGPKRGNASPGNAPKRTPNSSNFGPGKIPTAPKKKSSSSSNYGAGKIPSAARARHTGRGN